MLSTSLIPLIFLIASVEITLIVTVLNKKTTSTTFLSAISLNWIIFLLTILHYTKKVDDSERLLVHSTEVWMSSLDAISLSANTSWLSSYLAILSAFITTLAIFGSLSIKFAYSRFILLLTIIQLCLLISFYTSNLIIFYIFFEAVLIPMFILIAKWGPRNRKIKASFYLFLYTLFGSFFLLWAIYYIYIITGSVNYDVILNYNFSFKEIKILWILLVIPFGIKIPMYPVHLWLPEAHVEAPTVGSVILASLLLKLGGYGFLQILLPIVGTNYSMIPFIYCLALAGVVFGSLSTIRQIDLKKIVAYSSIAHMNLIVLGIFSANTQGLNGAIYLMIAHAFVSTGLFLCIGIIYDRSHTRLVRYYGGLAQTMPIFSLLFLFFTLANMSFPSTANFIGEILIFIGIYQNQQTVCSWVILPLASSGIVLSAIYSISVYNKLIFGCIKKNYIWSYIDITFSECLILVMFFSLTLIGGVFSWSIC